MSGQLLFGHKTVPKDVIDYVVFERSLRNHDSQWRICAKLPPQKPYVKEQPQSAEKQLQASVD